MASVSTQYAEVPTPRSVVSQDSDAVSQDAVPGPLAGLSVPGLESMQNSRLLDIVDRVRQIDIERKIELPEIVVCGDQSSGKSSVLEGVTGIPFPRAEGTCTKFATEIQLRRSDRSFGQVTIRPDPHRANKAALQGFRETVTDFRQLPAIMERAAALILRNERGPQTFSQDVLEVHVEGPKKHPFTIIDLPGLVRNERLAGDRAIVENIVDSYVGRSRSIILAVLAANYDADNQGILSTAQRVDPDGSRTLGIITKPDRVETSSAALAGCLRMAMNQDPKYHFQLGWHVVKNRTSDETNRQTTADERDRNEVAFFEDPRRGWSSLPYNVWGVATLRNRLTTLLESHTRRHLPIVLQEVMNKLDANQAEIDTLTGYDTPEQLRDRFVTLCYDMTSVAEKGLSGKANDAFYGLDDKERWIRATIVKQNEAFDKDLRASGHNGRFEWDGDTIATGMNTFQNFVHEFLGWSRGHEMPGNIDPQRKDTVFWHLSRDWHSIAKTHTLNAHEAVKQFLQLVVQTYIGEEFPHAVGRVQSALTAELNRRQKSANEELKKLEADRCRPVKTQNKSYLRQREEQLALLSFRDANRINRAADRLPSGLTANRIAELTGSNDIQKSRFNTAEQFCLEILIHYKIARDVFVDNVEMQVIERHLMDRLHYVFNVLANKPMDEVAAMLKDDNHDERMRKRQSALNRRKMLEAMRDELKSA